eukprot:g12836.t1
MPRVIYGLFEKLKRAHEACCNIRWASNYECNFTRESREAVRHCHANGIRCPDSIPAASTVDDLIAFISCEVSTRPNKAHFYKHLFEEEGVSAASFPLIWSVDAFLDLFRDDLTRFINDAAEAPEAAIGLGDCQEMAWTLRHWSNTICRLRSQEDDRYQEVLGFTAPRPVTVFSLAHDDATRRKFNHKVFNVFTEDCHPLDPSDTVLLYSIPPVQRIPYKAKGTGAANERKKTLSEMQFVYDATGASFGKQTLQTMDNYSRTQDIDAAAWVSHKVMVCQLLVDQASWEMACWQILAGLLPLVYVPAQMHRASNAGHSKNTGIAELASHVRSFMRGPKSKRKNLGDMHDTRMQMLERVRDPNKPYTNWRWQDEAEQEAAREAGAAVPLKTILEKRIDLQSSAERRWWRPRFLALFMRKRKLRLAMYLSQQQNPADLDVNRAAESHLDAHDLELFAELSSDEEADQLVPGNAESFLRALAPFLRSDVYENCTIALTDEGFDFTHLLENITHRYRNTQTLLAHTVKTMGEYGTVGLEDGMDQLTQELSFAFFEHADPQMGFFESLLLRRQPSRLPISIKEEGSLFKLFQHLSYEPGVPARAWATLYDARECGAIRWYLLESYGSRMHSEIETETCHRERWSNNDRRCRVSGSNFSLQRDRIALGKKHKRHPTTAPANFQYNMSPDEIRDTLDQYPARNVEEIRDTLRCNQATDVADARSRILAASHWVEDHPNGSCFTRAFCPGKVLQAPPSYMANQLGFRGAELMATLQSVGSKVGKGEELQMTRDLSMKAVAEMKIDARLEKGIPVLCYYPIMKTSIRVLSAKEGALQCLPLERVPEDAGLGLDGEPLLDDAGVPVPPVPPHTFAFPEDRDDLHPIAAWAIDVDHYTAKTSESTNDVRKRLRMTLENEAVVDTEDILYMLCPKLPPAQRHLVVSWMVEVQDKKISKEDWSYLSLQEQVRFYRKLIARQLDFGPLQKKLREARLKEEGFDGEGLFEVEISAKRQKLAEEVAAKQKEESEQEARERKKREEAGRMKASFVASIVVDGVDRCKIASHRVNKGKDRDRLKLTWIDYVATSATQSMSRQWALTSDPRKLCEEFFSTVAGELSVEVGQLVLEVWKMPEDGLGNGEDAMLESAAGAPDNWACDP